MKRALSFLIFFLSVYISKSQINDTIYFSKLGDTVLLSPYADGYTYSDSMTHHLFVMSFDKKDTLKKISSLDILVNRKDRLEDFISLDTLKKYRLEFDGYLQRDTIDKDVILTFTPKNTVKIDTYYLKDQFIYSVEIEILLKCKSKIIMQETITYFYIAMYAGDFDKSDICSFKSWKKKGVDKFLINYKIKQNVYDGKPFRGFNSVTNWYYGYY